MANQHEAQIRLTLDGGQFIGSLRRAGDQVSRFGRLGQKATMALKSGVDGAKASLRSLGGVAKSAIGVVGGLAGAFSAGQAIRQAVSLNEQFETLAFRVQVATGEMTKASDVQRLVEQSAAKTTRTSEEMAGAFQTVFGATKDLEFTKAVMADIGTTATATNESVEDVATVAQQMQRKFGLSASQVSGAMAQIFEGAQQGGPAFTDFARVIDVVGANLLQAGLSGQKALDFLIGSLNATDAEFGDLGKQVTGIQNLLINLGQKSRIDKIAKNLRIDPRQLLNERDVLGRLRKILATGQKGVDELRATFIGPEEQKALRVLFTDPFEQALQRARSAGLRGKEATEQALRALDESIAQFGKSSLTAADLQKRAAERQQEPAARLRVATERLQQAFSQPEIIEAVEALADALPELASIFGKFVTFAAKNPVLAGTLGIGGVAAKGFVSGMMQSIVAGHVAGGGQAATAIGGALAKGGSGIAGQILRVAGPFAAIAAAGLAGGLAIKSKAEEKGQATGGLAVARAQAASRRGGVARQEAQAQKLQAAIATKREEMGGFFDALFQSDKARAKEEESLRLAEEELEAKRAFIAQLKDRAAKEPAAAESPVATGERRGKTKVALEDTSARLMAQAVTGAMGATTLSVRLVNPEAIGVVGPAAVGPGASRGPAMLPPTRAGGGF